VPTGVAFVADARRRDGRVRGLQLFGRRQRRRDTALDKPVKACGVRGSRSVT